LVIAVKPAPVFDEESAIDEKVTVVFIMDVLDEFISSDRWRNSSG
jgi:hypothetical protein